VTVSGNRLTLTGDVKDVPARRSIAHKDYIGAPSELRRLVHRFADDVALALTGEAGVASTQIAYVQKSARESELWVTDADGFGARPLTAFPLAAHLAGVAAGRVGAAVLVPARGGVGTFTGSRSAGGRAWWCAARRSTSPRRVSPHGRGSRSRATARATARSMSARPGAAHGRQRLTVNRAIDTSPSWSPNGQRIAFTLRPGGQRAGVRDGQGWRGTSAACWPGSRTPTRPTGRRAATGSRSSCAPRRLRHLCGETPTARTLTRW